jgi:predicted nucleotidyltransferase
LGQGLAALEHLPEHRRVLDAVLAFLRRQPGALGAFVSGSVATGTADQYSDLDLGLVFADDRSRARVWERRNDWEIAPWFHRFDADHVKDHFVIYLYEPGVKADLNLYVPADLPRPPGLRYEPLWDETGELARWAEEVAALPVPQPDWNDAVHEEERFWGWLYFCVRHVQRGEYYDIATDFFFLRRIVEGWQARLDGRPVFDPRRVHEREPPDVFAALVDCFPRPDRASLKRSLQRAIELHERQRALAPALEWRTSESTRRRVRSLVDDL